MLNCFISMIYKYFNNSNIEYVQYWIYIRKRFTVLLLLLIKNSLPIFSHRDFENSTLPICGILLACLALESTFVIYLKTVFVKLCMMILPAHI